MPIAIRQVKHFDAQHSNLKQFETNFLTHANLRTLKLYTPKLLYPNDLARHSGLALHTAPAARAFLFSYKHTMMHAWVIANNCQLNTQLVHHANNNAPSLHLVIVTQQLLLMLPLLQPLGGQGSAQLLLPPLVLLPPQHLQAVPVHGPDLPPL